MIKVIHVISDTNIGGAGRLLLNCLKNFDRNEFSIKVVLPKDSKLKPEIESLSCKTIEIDGNKDKSFDRSTIGELTKLFKTEKPDIVHTHASMSGRIAAFLAGVKIRLYTRHCAFEPRKILTLFPLKQINGIIDDILTYRVIATAEVAKNDIIRTGIRKKKIKVILNGVTPLSRYSETEINSVKERLNITPDKFVVGIIARLEECKGQAAFIEAINQLNDKDVIGIIVGDGSCRQKYIDKVLELKLQDNIIFTGFQNDVTPFINILDVNVNCSNLSETTCLALSEGMSLRKPSIATDCGGNSDMVHNGRNGFLIPINDVLSLANSIKILKDDRELYKKMSDSAREIYQAKFTAEFMVKEIEKLYKACVEERIK